MTARAKEPKRIGIIGDAPGGNYLALVLSLLASADIAPASLGEATIYHDQGCALFAGEPCDCSPDVSMTWRDPS